MSKTYNYKIIVPLFLVILVSGCINGIGGGEETESQAIFVEELSVQPTQIYSGGTISARTTVRNSGNIPADIEVGEDGENVLTSYTPDLLNITDFSGRTTQNPETQTEYTLEPDESLTMQWELEQYDEDRIRFYEDDDASMTFRVPFEYSVDAFQQIQIKRDHSETPLTDLESRSSPGPLSVAVQTVGSSSDSGNNIFIDGDNKQVHLQLVNNNPEEGAHQGLMRIDTPEISTEGNIEIEEENDCEMPDEDELILHDDESTVISCDINLPEDVDMQEERSIRDEIRVSSDYEYVRTIGDRTITVDYRG